MDPRGLCAKESSYFGSAMARGARSAWSMGPRASALPTARRRSKLQKRVIDAVTALGLVGLLLAASLPLLAFAQGPSHLNLNLSAVKLGEDETHVRQEIKVSQALYLNPFTPSRLTLKAPNGVYIDFEHGKVIEIDYTSRSAGVSIGGVGVGSSVAETKAALGNVDAESANAFFYTTAIGEIVQFRVRTADQTIAVIAVVGDRTHPFVRSRAAKIVLKNQ